jgi:hypothetical protein
MRSGTKRGQGAIRPLLIAVLLAAAQALAAQAGRPIERAYLDAGAVAEGAILKAAHPRLGLELGIAERWSVGAEADLYYSRSEDGTGEVSQAGLLGLGRWRPSKEKGPSLAAGAGALLFSAYASAGAGGGSDYRETRLCGLLAAEASWTLALFRSPLYLEPMLRGYLVAGRSDRGGAWFILPSAEAGLRLGWRFSAKD